MKARRDAVRDGDAGLRCSLEACGVQDHQVGGAAGLVDHVLLCIQERRIAAFRQRQRVGMAVALPPGCTTVVTEGTTLQQCGGTYYQTSGSQYTVVKVE